MKKKIIIFLSIFFISINSIYAKETVEFSDCVDGDTIKVLLDGEKYTIRMLAVDTPESVHPTKGVEYYGKEASNYTCEKVKNAKKLEIEYDNDSDKTDKYDRLLVWVFTDGTLLQKDLVANGYAKVAYLYGDYKYTSQLQDAQELASAKSIGIWDEEAKNKYNNENGITEDLEDEETQENKLTQTTPSSDITTFINKIKSFETMDYIIIGLLLLLVLFCSNTTIKSKAKKSLKKYLK